MDFADFDFELPPHAIAQHPVRPRDAARLLEVWPGGWPGAGPDTGSPEWADRSVADLPGLLEPGDLMVVNDTRVLPSRLSGRRGAAAIEATLIRREGPATWRALARPARRLKVGDTVTFQQDLAARVAEKCEDGAIVLAFEGDDATLIAALERIGRMPLPPYIRRPTAGAAAQSGQTAAAAGDDRADYQTVFAARLGAVAAPTAGLHFTTRLLDALTARGVGLVRVTLHVGAGTFQPVRVARIEDHRMHAEWGEVTADAAHAINRARAAGGRVLAVGTTALRLIESAAGEQGDVRPFAGETDIFIVPGYRFRATDLLMTNFHLPRSTLFMLVAAFAGLPLMQAAYRHALSAGYRFYSYGDACLLHPAKDTRT
jgi:S-adenosylmethionine:tRNA ribosyltransferase-isomerase